MKCILFALGIVMFAASYAHGQEAWAEPLHRLQFRSHEQGATVYELKCHRKQTDADRASLQSLLDNIFSLEDANAKVVLKPVSKADPCVCLVIVNIPMPDVQKLEFTYGEITSYNVETYRRCQLTRSAYIKVFCAHQRKYGPAEHRITVTNDYEEDDCMLTFEIQWDPD